MSLTLDRALAKRHPAIDYHVDHADHEWIWGEGGPLIENNYLS